MPKNRSRHEVYFDDQSVDTVSIATPNHWHALAAIWAMQAGKDVYVEKPVSHNIVEGRRMVQVARKTGRVCQVGTQNRSSGPLAEAADFIQSGKLGEVKLARTVVYGHRGSIGGSAKCEIPLTLAFKTCGWGRVRALSPSDRSCITTGTGFGTRGMGRSETTIFTWLIFAVGSWV